MSFTEITVSETPGTPSQRNLRIFADGSTDSGIQLVTVTGQPGNLVLRRFTARDGDFAERCQPRVDLTLEHIDVSRFPLSVDVQYCNEGYDNVNNIAPIVTSGTGSPHSPGGCPPGSTPTTLCQDAINRVRAARSAVTTACESVRQARSNLQIALQMYAVFSTLLVITMVAIAAVIWIPIYGQIAVTFLALLAVWLVLMVSLSIYFVWQYRGELAAAQTRYNGSLAAFNAEVQRVVNLCCPDHYRPDDLMCPPCV